MNDFTQICRIPPNSFVYDATATARINSISVSGNSTDSYSLAQNHNGDNAPDNVSRCYGLLGDAHVPRNFTAFTVPSIAFISAGCWRSAAKW